MLITGLAWCRLLVEYCDVFISCLDSHSDGTHSLQRTHWWASDVMLHFSILMNKQTSLSLHLGLPEGEYIFNKIHFWEKDFKMYKTWAVCRRDSCSQHKLCYCLNTRKESERERLAVSVWALAIWPRLLWHLLDPREQLKEKRHLTSDVLESTGFTISNTACFSMLFAKSILASHLSDCRELKRSTKESIALLWSHLTH